MKKDIKTKDKIDLFLCGNASMEAIERWKHEDEDFAAEVALYERVRNEIGDKKKRAFKAELERLGNIYLEKGNVPADAKADQENVPNANTDLVELVELPLSPQASSVEEKEILEDVSPGSPLPMQPVGKDNKRAKIRRLTYRFVQMAAACLIGVLVWNSDTESPPRIPGGINAIVADFSPNPILENMVGSYTRSRSRGYAIQVDTPLAEKYPMKSEKSILKLSARIHAEEVLKPGDIRLTIFNNKEIDYGKDRPELRESLALTKGKGKPYIVTFSGSLKLAPGLYYYMIEDKTGDDVLYVRKFTVGEEL